MMALTRIRMGLISEVPTLRGKREKMGAGMTIHRLSKKLAKQIRQMMTLRTFMGDGWRDSIHSITVICALRLACLYCTRESMERLQLEHLPFLTSLCWQGDEPTIGHLSELDILNLYERNWRLRGVMADLSADEVVLIRRIAAEYHSWLVNEV
jgi:hypothetical protein